MNIESRPGWGLLGPSLPPTVVLVLAGLAMFTGKAGSSGPPPSARVMASATAATAPAQPPQPPATVTSDWLNRQISSSRTGRVIDDYLGDVGCLSGAASLVTAQARGVAAGLVASGERVPCDLDAIIVTVSAYEDSNSRWQADRTLATIQGAVSAANYTLERFHLPGSKGGPVPADETDVDAAHGPGVLLFRRVSGALPAELRQEPTLNTDVRQTAVEYAPAPLQVLAVLTVPESPMAGLPRVPLLLAAHLALTLHAVPRPRDLAHASELRVVGPFYSGSSLSLLRGLEEVAHLEGESADRRGLQVQVVSGSATSESNCDLLTGPLAHDGRVNFERTVHGDDTLLFALQEQLGSIRAEWATGEGVALLFEANTGWGASIGQVEREVPAVASAADARLDGVPCGVAPAVEPTLFTHALRLGFPLHIADRYASRQRSVQAPSDLSSLVAAPEVLRLEDSITPSDRLPTFTPNLTDAARDLTLDGILAQLQRRRVGAIGILSTDERDRLFLAREINRVAPDVILFGTEPDILMLHPAYAPYVRGMLMASSYPMQGHAQSLTHGPGAHERRVQFTSMAQQGLYNAVLLAVGPISEVGPLLVDYRAPAIGRARRAAQCDAVSASERPAPWVVVAGQREFTPLSVHPWLVSQQDCVVMRSRVSTPGDPEQHRYLFATAQERVSWMLLPIIAVVLIALLWRAQRVVLPPARALSPPALLAHCEEGRGRSPLARRSPGAGGSGPFVDALGERVRPSRARHQEQVECATEHAILAAALAMALFVFATWQVQVWRDIIAPGVPTLLPVKAAWINPDASDGAIVRAMVTVAPPVAFFVVALALSVAAACGAAVLVWLGLQRSAVVARGRTNRLAPWRLIGMRAVASSAPELMTTLVLVTGSGFVFATLAHLWRRPPGSDADLLFASGRAFDLLNMVSPAPLLAVFPGMMAIWMVWSLRTLYYQRISPVSAAPLLRALVSLDTRDRRLERSLAATLGTTMQPAGAYLLMPLAVLVVMGLLLAPRVASIEGAAFGRVILFGTTLGALAASLELGQAAWLATRVTRLLERVRIHPIVSDVEAMEQQPFDWRPALRPSRSPYRLLLRAVRGADLAAGGEGLTIVRQDRVPVLRTEAWRVGLEAAGTWLPRTGAIDGLTPPQRTLVAMVISLLLQSLVTRVVRGFGIAVLLAVLLLSAHLLTPFSGRSLALLIDIGLIVVAAALATRALLTLERDHVLSKLWHGTPGSLNWNSGLVWRAVVYAGLPLLTIISMRFPEVGSQLVTVVEPLRHMLPAP